MLAWALADVLGGNPHPPIALGRRDHGLEQPAIRLLDLATPTELRLSLAEPDREPVADPLELGDTKNARPADSGHIPMDPRSREGRCEELAQPLLEQRDLPPQLVAGLAIGSGVDDRVEGGGLGRPDRLIQ